MSSRRARSPEAGLRRALRERTGLAITRAERRGEVEHAFTHRSLRLHVFRCDTPEGRVRLAEFDAHRWLVPGALARAPAGQRSPARRSRSRYPRRPYEQPLRTALPDHHLRRDPRRRRRRRGRRLPAAARARASRRSSATSIAAGPARAALTTPRDEPDRVEILSGVFEGQTLGTPIALLVRNQDARPEAYEAMKDVYRPSHADYTYEAKYGIRNWQGGGRASARETIGRVAAGAIARKLLRGGGGRRGARLGAARARRSRRRSIPARVTLAAVEANPVRCPDADRRRRDGRAHRRRAARAATRSAASSSASARGVPAGLGEPVFDKLEADLARALMSLPASKGFEIGSGFAGTRMTGIEHNDPFVPGAGRPAAHRHQPLRRRAGRHQQRRADRLRVAFKPTATISQPQQTVDRSGARRHARGAGPPRSRACCRARCRWSRRWSASCSPTTGCASAPSTCCLRSPSTGTSLACGRFDDFARLRLAARFACPVQGSSTNPATAASAAPSTASAPSQACASKARARPCSRRRPSTAARRGTAPRRRARARRGSSRTAPSRAATTAEIGPPTKPTSTSATAGFASRRWR